MNIRNGLVLTTAVALALTVGACSSNQPNQSWTTDQPTAVCTDRQGNRVDDDLCDDDDGRGGGFGFIYLNSGSHVPKYGSKVSGGSHYKSPGTSYTSSKSASISRGGFGSSARGGFSSGS